MCVWGGIHPRGGPPGAGNSEEKPVGPASSGRPCRPDHRVTRLCLWLPPRSRQAAACWGLSQGLRVPGPRSLVLGYQPLCTVTAEVSLVSHWSHKMECRTEAMHKRFAADRGCFLTMMGRGPLVLMSDKPRAWRKGVMQATGEALAGEACGRLVRRAAEGRAGRGWMVGLGGHVLPQNRCQRRRLLITGGAGATGIADRERRCWSGTRP